MKGTFTLPLVRADGRPYAHPGHVERARIEDLVNTGLSYTQVGAVIDQEYAAGYFDEPRYARLVGALTEWLMMLMTLDTEEHDHPIPGDA